MNDYGELLCTNFSDILELYSCQATCVCFLGEGKGSQKEKNELITYAEYVHDIGLKACLYSGRDVSIEAWMHVLITLNQEATMKNSELLTAQRPISDFTEKIPMAAMKTLLTYF